MEGELSHAHQRINGRLHGYIVRVTSTGRVSLPPVATVREERGGKREGTE